MWIDDNLAEFITFANALTKKGIIVKTATNYDDAIKEFSSFKPDVVLVDITMPYPGGIEIARTLHESEQKALFCIFSSFLYKKEYENISDDLPFIECTIEKNFCGIHSELFEKKFIQPVMNLFRHVNNPNKNIDAKQIDKVLPETPLKIKYNDFIGLSTREKDYLIEKVENELFDEINREFNKGKIWVLICGSKKILKSASNFNEIPCLDEIYEIARKKNRAFYQFSAPLVNEDYWFGDCSIESLKNYPTVMLDFNGQKRIYHLDTGCATSLFSYEDLVAHNIIPPRTDFVAECRNGFWKRYKIAYIKDVDAILECPSSGETLVVKINGKAVRDWVSTSYSRECRNPICKELYNYDNSLVQEDYNLCCFRKALIGRNIVVDNNIRIILNGKERQTCLK